MSELDITSALPKAELEDVNSPPIDEINPPVSQPAITQLFDSMSIKDQLRTDIGPSATIDVIPDFTQVILQLVDHSIKIYEQIAQLSVPYITPASLLASFLDSIYTYGAIADIYMVRETTSYYGNVVLNMPHVYQAFNLAMHNAVPAFLQQIIRAYQFTFDPHRKNLAYIYSFATFSFDHDYGRIYPIHMFIALHNILATSGPTDTHATLWIKWLNYEVIKTETETLTVAHLIGGAINDNLIENYITIALHRLLSPAALVGARQRKILEPFEFEIPTQPTFNLINPYIYLLPHEPLMVPIMMNFRNLMRAATNQFATESVPLADLFTIDSGAQIMSHVYSQPTLPTFHNMSININDESTTTTLDAFATLIKYRCSYVCEPAKIKKCKIPESGTYESKLYLVQKTSDPKKVRSPDSDLMYTQHLDHSNWIIYQPYNSGKPATYFPMTSGLRIESYEIDAFHVPQPSTDNSIHDENSHFLESAIPINSTTSRIFLSGEVSLSARRRASESKHRTKVSMSLYDMTKHRLPYYPAYIDPEPDTAELLPGFTLRSGIKVPDNATTKASYTGTTTYSQKPDTSGKMTEKKISPLSTYFQAWSSYRWTIPKESLTPAFLDHTFLLMNFRTIYGTTPETMMSEPLSDIVEEH